MDNLFYDAFISYRHTELDSFVAQKMHKMLEHYRIPKKIQQRSGKKKITRIFRDQEELPLSADLSENITTALRHSEFLILICSPEAMESRWVRTEVKTFLETHSKNNVLTVLVKGEPEESFPEVLCYRDKVVVEDGVEKKVQVPIEPLAADVRGVSKAEVEKKLKNEILRILAPMLSCSYDELRQRHREYKMKCMLGIGSVILVLALAFSVYAMRQAAAIEEQYQNARRNQARYLCNVSGDLLDSGDRIGALQTALALQTEEGTEALVPEQMYALNNALYSYQYSTVTYLEPDRRLEMENSAKYLYPEYIMEFSPEGAYFLSMDEIGKVYFFESSTGELLYSCTASEFAQTEDQTFVNGIPVSETGAVLLTETRLLYVDIYEQQVLKCFEADSTDQIVTFYSPSSKAEGEFLAVSDNNHFYVYNYVTGEQVYEREMENYGVDVIDFAFSPSKKEIAVGVYYNDYLSDENDFYRIEIVSLDGGGKVSWDVEAYEEFKLSYVDEEHLAVMWIPLSDETQVLETYRTYCYGVYHVPTGEMLWQGEGNGVFADYTDFTLATETMYRTWDSTETEPMVITCIVNQFKVLNAMTGELISHSESKDNIVGFERLDDVRFMIATENGEIGPKAASVNGDFSGATKINTQLSGFTYDSNTATAAVVTTSDDRVIFCRSFQDKDMTGIGAKASSIYYMSSETNDYRLVRTGAGDSETEEETIVWNLSTDEEILRLKAEEKTQELTPWDCVSIDGEEYLLYSISEYDYRSAPQKVCLAKLNGGEVLYQILLKNLPDHTGEFYTDRYDDEYAIAYSEDTQIAAIYYENDEYFELMDCKTGEIILPFQKVQGHESSVYASIYSVKASSDGKYFIFAGKYNNYGDNFLTNYSCFLKLWNIDAQKWETIGENEECLIEIPASVGSDIYQDNYLIGAKTMKAIVYLDGNEILVVDLLTGEISQTIPFYGKNRFKIAFFNEERFLLLYGDEGHLMMWDLQEQKMTMKDTELLEYVTEIYTDASSRYFGISSNNDAYTHTYNVYYVDEDYRFYHYADIRNGFARFSAEEAFCFGTNQESYYTKFYDYETLKAKAEEIIGGKEFTDAERRMYYLLEE